MEEKSRKIVLDTETTGLSAADGDRVIEIACVEISNYIPTGRVFHKLINPEREVSKDAQRVHGIGAAQLKDAPLFADIIDEFLEFVGDAPLVIHNAEFDIGFLAAEFARAHRKWRDDLEVIDTLAIARQKFPGAPASLDALCRRFGISLEEREKHSAVIDTQLLAEVYLHLSGGTQASLMDGAVLEDAPATQMRENETIKTGAARAREKALPPRLTEADEAAHSAFLDDLPNPAVWKK